MRKLLLAVLLTLAADTASADPITCGFQPDWSDYFFAYPNGCTVGDKLMTGFAWSSSQPGSIGTILRWITPLSTDDTAGFDITLLNSSLSGSPFNAGPGETKTFGIAFVATVLPGGGLITGDLFSLLGVQLTGTGTIAATQIACLGGTFPVPLSSSPPPPCSSGQTALASVISPGTSAMASFAPVDSIDLALFVTVSGGSNGTAYLTGVQMIVQEAPLPVPEPSMLVLFGSGLAGFVPMWRRRRTKRR